MKFSLKTPSDVIVEKTSKSGIYKILNTITEKFYIGSAVNFKARWTQHKSKLKLNVHPNKYLQSSWNLHGETAFEFIILEYCDREKIPEREQAWLNNLKPYDRNIGYNLYLIAGSPLGTKWTEERKIIASERMKNFKHTDETKAKMREIQSNRSKETCAKLSAAKLGHDVSDETKLKISKGNTGKVRSAQHKAVISAANKGKVLSIETRLKIRKLDKWPHILGSLCDCEECKISKRLDAKFRKNKNRELLNVQA